MKMTNIRAWPRRLETWALEIVTNHRNEWKLLEDAKPDDMTDCEFAHIPKASPSYKGVGTWIESGFFSRQLGLWVSDPAETYWKKA